MTLENASVYTGWPWAASGGSAHALADTSSPARVPLGPADSISTKSTFSPIWTRFLVHFLGFSLKNGNDSAIARWMVRVASIH